MKNNIILSTGLVLLTQAWSHAGHAAINLSQVPKGFTFKIQKEIPLKSAKTDFDLQDKILFFSKGKVVGVSTEVPKFLEYVITRDELKAELGELLGKSSPDAGVYCYTNIPTSENHLSLTAGTYSIEACIQSEAVSKIEGNTTSNYSFSLFGKTNKSSISTCVLRPITEDNSAVENRFIGCVSYRSENEVETNDFAKAIGASSTIVSFSDPRTPAELEDLRKKEQEKEKLRLQREAEHNDIADRYEASQKWGDEVLKKLPKHNDSRYLEVVAQNPELGKLREECMDDYLMRGLEFRTMPPSCQNFFALWKSLK